MAVGGLSANTPMLFSDIRHPTSDFRLPSLKNDDALYQFYDLLGIVHYVKNIQVPR